MNRPATESAAAPWYAFLFSRRLLLCVLQGFSSGLPLYVLIQLVPGWLRSEGVDLSTIGLLSLATLPYTWKFAWSPLLDRFRPPFWQAGGTDAHLLGTDHLGRDVLAPDGRFAPVPAGDLCHNPLAFRPPTKFERRGRRLGHEVVDLYYRKLVTPTEATTR